VPAAMKMKTINGRVALIDGFAGPNSYGGEVKGSTVIMVEAAKKLRAQGASSKVFACEADHDRYELLKQNLKDSIDADLLEVFPSYHSGSIPSIMEKITDSAALVFLDPQTVSEMTLDGDIFPWARRKSTDVLGVFMGGDACRVCASLISTNSQSDTMLKSLGSEWRGATTEDAAYKTFFKAIGGKKHYNAIHRLRKQEPKKLAYGIFAMSDSVHGMWLMSEAVAKDWGVLKTFDQANRELNLFTEVEDEDQTVAFYETLVSVCRPVLAQNPKLTGSALGIAVMRNPQSLRRVYGRFTAADFSKAARAILSEEKLSA
jgi:three-Cys-motif partner protein